MAQGYQNWVGKLLIHKIIAGAIYTVVIVGLLFLFKSLPSSFLPDEDQGVVMTLVQLQPNATLDRTEKVIDQMTGFFLEGEKAAQLKIIAIDKAIADFKKSPAAFKAAPKAKI